MLINDGFESGIEGIGHDLETRPDTGDDEVGVVTVTLVWAHG